MAGLIFSSETRGQLAAIARLRWRLFVNSLRTLRGRLEMVSRIFFAFGFAAMGFIGAIAFAVLGFLAVSRLHAEWLAALLWLLFLAWQLFPVLATAFTEQMDSSNLLRFPLSYASYFLIRVAYGSFDPGTAIGLLWLVGLEAGIGVASPALALWAAPVLIAFAVLNVFLARMIFAWLERWLARRRTREIMGFVFFIFIISFQFIGPAIQRFAPKGVHPSSDTVSIARQLVPIERALPPGLAAAAIARAAEGHAPAAAGAFVLLCAYAMIFLWVLSFRLRAQYHGENLSEGVPRRAVVSGKLIVRPGWSIPSVSGAISAIVEKEFHYLFRSGPMLFIFVMPVVVLFIFRVTPTHPDSGGTLLAHIPDLAFPIGAAYSLLILTNLVFNSFGGDAVGVQIFFAAPVRFRDVLLAKNLAHTALMAIEIFLVWIGVCLMYEPPSLGVTFATLAGMLFAIMVSLTVGNLLSIYSPKKIDLGAFGRQRATASSQFAALGCQFVIFGIGAVTLLMARHFGAIWVAGIAFLALAAIALAVYSVCLVRVEKLALARREIVIGELSRA